ncbi:terminase small subunit [Mucilaginibacter sp. SP1R1]|uniref:terminase small subunit n=1 Tax=Mucilaginibacter sp. SP1R1 TaxID=2723091 RepID=UPI00160E4481|nr:terminase small subunit [Mucilaginibacter sp. SP1R1]MBB6149611.1 hypothetical protein [Mucilaginibacter sp. SP1R1]
MKNQSLYLKTATTLARRIDEYFLSIEGIYHLEQKSQKPTSGKAETIIEHKIYDREPEPATIAGMALFLGFSSKHEFETYQETGKYADILKRGCLRVEAAYEARLHQTPTGVIFALKTMGWNDKPEIRTPPTPADNTLKVEIINSGPFPAGNEKEVTL